MPNQGLRGKSQNRPVGFQEICRQRALSHLSSADLDKDAVPSCATDGHDWSGHASVMTNGFFVGLDAMCQKGDVGRWEM